MSGQEQDKATGNVEQPFDQLAANLDGDEDELSQLGSPYIQFYFTRPENEVGVLDLYGGIVGGAAGRSPAR